MGEAAGWYSARSRVNVNSTYGVRTKRRAGTIIELANTAGMSGAGFTVRMMDIRTHARTAARSRAP